MISEFAFLNESFKSYIRSINFKLYNIVPCYNTDLFRKDVQHQGAFLFFPQKSYHASENLRTKFWILVLRQFCGWNVFWEKTKKGHQQNQTKFSMCQLCLNSRNLNCQKTMAPLCFPGLKETCISLPSGSEHKKHVLRIIVPVPE